MTRVVSIVVMSMFLFLFSCKKEEEGETPTIDFPIDISSFENEENAVFSFPLVLNRASEATVTVGYETKPISAAAGEDYIHTSGTITFEPGVASKNISVEIIVDEFKEEDEQFKVVLTSSDNGVFKDGYQEAIGTIKNDDYILQAPSTGYLSADSYPGKTLVWSDEFNASEINNQNWTYDLGANGWGNQELQNYTSNSANSYVANGNLMIVAEEAGSGYTSARLKSIGLQEYQYGRIDVRAALPQGQGIWPAIWMLGHDFPSVGWPACGEIDIMELIGSTPNTVHGTVHYGPVWNQHFFQGESIHLPFPETFTEEFHVFSIDWDENGITWYVDDVEFYSVTNTFTGSEPYPFDDQFFFILNVAVGGQWPGYPDETTTFPQFMAVDYVRVFQ